MISASLGPRCLLLRKALLTGLDEVVVGVLAEEAIGKKGYYGVYWGHVEYTEAEGASLFVKCVWDNDEMYSRLPLLRAVGVVSWQREIR